MVTQKRNIRNIFKLKRNKSLIKISTDNNQLLSAKTSNNVQYNDKKIALKNVKLLHHPKIPRVKSNSILSYELKDE